MTLTLLFTLLALPLAFWGLSQFNQNGSFGTRLPTSLLGSLALLIGLVLWMQSMGSLRGAFAFLGLLTLMGLVLSYRTKLKA